MTFNLFEHPGSHEITLDFYELGMSELFVMLKCNEIDYDFSVKGNIACVSGMEGASEVVDKELFVTDYGIVDGTLKLIMRSSSDKDALYISLIASIIDKTGSILVFKNET